MSQLRWTRSCNNKMIAGVLGGLSRRFGWNPRGTRIVFFLLCGYPTLDELLILVYVILWIALPRENEPDLCNRTSH